MPLSCIVWVELEQILHESSNEKGKYWPYKMQMWRIEAHYYKIYVGITTLSRLWGTYVILSKNYYKMET